jgi:hypothetical protein
MVSANRFKIVQAAKRNASNLQFINASQQRKWAEMGLLQSHKKGVQQPFCMLGLSFFLPDPKPCADNAHRLAWRWIENGTGLRLVF